LLYALKLAKLIFADPFGLLRFGHGQGKFIAIQDPPIDRYYGSH
jgi:hypothetical protein